MIPVIGHYHAREGFLEYQPCSHLYGKSWISELATFLERGIKGIALLHAGGTGKSEMGHYHGWEGFETMSKAKPVLQKGKLNGAKSVYVPYGRGFHKIFYKLMLR